MVNIQVTTPPQIDDQFLAAMRLAGLDEAQKQAALSTIIETLNLNVGDRVLEILSEEQLTQLEQVTSSGSEEEVNQWLSQNVPNFNKIVEEEAQKMRDEAAADVDKAMAGLK